jgi:hypothetical protein
MTHPWGTHTVPEDGELAFSIGPLNLEVCRVQGELRTRARRGDEAGDERWTRWAAPDLTRVSLAPLFPDRPLVVEPEDPFWLPRGARARIYVRVPVWVALDAHGLQRHTVLRIATVVASDTWWGTLAEGELCYWLPTRARRELAPGETTSHMVVCPLQLVNRSSDDLPVDKIALRVAHLSLYGHEDALWSDETHVTYTGDVEGSRIDMAGSAPPEAPGASLLSPPAHRIARGFRARTFRRLRSFTAFFE